MRCLYGWWPEGGSGRICINWSLVHLEKCVFTNGAFAIFKWHFFGGEKSETSGRYEDFGRICQRRNLTMVRGRWLYMEKESHEWHEDDYGEGGKLLKFMYHGSVVSLNDERMDVKIFERMMNGRQVAGSHRKIRWSNDASLQVWQSLVENIVQFIFMYGSETWVWSNTMTVIMWKLRSWIS